MNMEQMAHSTLAIVRATDADDELADLPADGDSTLDLAMRHTVLWQGAEIERLQTIIQTIYDESPPITWEPRDSWGDYQGYPGRVDEVDISNSDDVHAHGVEEGWWMAANKFREAAEAKEERQDET